MIDNNCLLWIQKYNPQYSLIKAGRLVGLADCCAVIAQADNATFLLATFRIAAFWSHSAIIIIVITCSRGSVGRASAPQSWDRGTEPHQVQHLSTCLCPLRHARSARNYPTSASAERATPKPHSLKPNIKNVIPKTKTEISEIPQHIICRYYTVRLHQYQR